MTSLRTSLSILLLGFYGCSCEPSPQAEPPTTSVEDAGSTPPMKRTFFDVLAEARDVARTSPDHLIAAADRVVATKDPQQILTFVASSIATVPASARGFGDAGTARLWGTRAALRSGSGTLREKADLLAELLTRAGFESELMVVGVTDSQATARQTLLGHSRPPFAPTLADGTLAGWREVIGPPAPDAGIRPIDPEGQLGSIAAAVTAALPSAEVSPAAFAWDSLVRMPLVRVTVGSSQLYANPIYANAALGETYSTYLPDPAPPAQTLPSVSVKLSVARASNPSARQIVAEGAFALEDLFGRQLVTQFTPAEPLESALLQPLTSLKTFVPVLGVRGPDLSAADASRLAVASSIITVGGDVVRSTPDGAVTVNGEPLRPLADDPTAPGRVASVAIRAVEAGAFPRIVVHAQALDAAGQPVAGVPASAIQLSEEGAQQPFIVLSNEPRPPRVLFLLDTSESLPADFRGAQAAATLKTIATELLKLDPQTRFAVSAVLLGITSPSAWTSDPAQLESDALAVSGHGSALWEALSEAARVDATTIVFVTDGVEEAPPTQDDLARVAAGPPAVLLGVGTTNPSTLERMAEVSGGAVYNVADTAGASTAVAAFLRARREAPLVLQYDAPTAGPSTRHVRLQVASAPASDPFPYTVPGQSDQVAPGALCGLYLTLTHEGQEVTRVLGGRWYAADGSVPQAVIDETRLALLGSHFVSFEGGAPTLAHWLDDIATAKLALQPLYEAALRKDVAAALAALQQGIPHVPGVLATLHHALPHDPSMTTYETPMRAVLLSTYLHPVHGKQQRADILPLTGFSTVGGADAAADFQATLQRSLFLAAAEGAVYDVSTWSMLQGKSLVGVTSSSLTAELPTLSEADRARWREVLAPFSSNINVIPRDGTQFAFYTVDRYTGRALGILPDGSGGGLSRTPEGAAMDALTLLNWLSVAGEFGGFGFAYGGFIALQKAILKVIIAQAIAVSMIGPGPNPGDTLGKPTCDLACDMLKGAAFEGLGLGAAAKVDALSEAVAGASLPCGC